MSTSLELNRRGIEAKRAGRWEEAVACYEQALAIDPDYAEALYNLALLWRELNQPEKSLALLEQVVALRPDVVEPRCELAGVLLALRDYSRALDEYRQLLASLPGHRDLLLQIGQVLLELRRWPEAEETFQQLTEQEPTNADGWTSLGIALQEQQRWAEAAAAYRTALALQPMHAVALTNLGGLLREQGDVEQALACHQQAILAQPDLVEAHLNLGNTLYQLDRVSEALAAYHAATQLAPHHAAAWLRLGDLLRERGDAELARKVYHGLAAREGGHPLHRLRTIAACPLVFRSHAELDAYRAEFLQVTNELRGALRQLPRDEVLAGPECPFNLQFLDGNLRPLKAAFAAVYSDALPPGPDRSRSSRARPRIGFVAITRWASSFLEPLGGLVKHLDARLFEPVVFCRQSVGEEMRRGLMSRDVAVVGVSDRLREAMQTIGDAACDLLYYCEVGNSPANYFLPFHRLAPVQVTSWAVQVTSGIPTIDAYISSHWIEGPEAAEHYTEQLVLGDTLLVHRRAVAPPCPRMTRQDYGWPTDAPLYGCIQNLGKFHPQFDPWLADLLRSDPQGLVILAEDRDGVAARQLRTRWQTSIPDVVDRIRFVPNLRHAEYLDVLAACDVLLDPPHFGGVTTTYDALALAKPVVTCPTPFQRGRYTAGLLRRLGLHTLVTPSSAAYVQRAVELATDRAQAAEVAAQLRAAGPAAFENLAAVREHEQMFADLLRQ